VKSETCSRCGEEVRFGVRNKRLAWWHRDDQPLDLTITRRDGHEPVFGTPAPSLGPANLDLDYTEPEEDTGETDTRIFDTPPPEVYATEVPEGKMPGGAQILINAIRRAGGRAVATYSRGPRVHSAHGNLLEVSDWVVVKFGRDGRRAVARWVTKNGKWHLDCSYTIEYDQRTAYPTKTDAAGLRAWMLKWHGPHKEEHP
jgi:hypothetical protein